MNFKKILVLDMGFDLASMNFCQGLSMQLLEVVVSEIYKIEPDAKIRFRFHPGETSSHYDLCKDFINKHLPKLEVSTNPDIRLDFEWATAVIGPPSSAMIEGYQYKLPYLLVNILEQVGHFSNKFEPTFNNSVYTTDELIEKLRDPLDINIVELMKSNFDDWDKLGTPFVWDSYLNYINTTIGRRENG